MGKKTQPRNKVKKEIKSTSQCENPLHLVTPKQQGQLIFVWVGK